MVRSLEIYGQISPVVCVKTPEGLELVDGFKRLRASRHLDRSTVKTAVLETTVRGGKAGIIQLNRVSRSITDLEEAMVLQSLHRDEKLSQVDIATLLGRDKSWVSRRISLIERLADEIRRHVELGLISTSVGRELARLPRGNQPETLAVVLNQRLGKREVEKLVRILLSKPNWNWPAILANVWDAISPHESVPVMTLASFSRQLTTLQHLQQTISTEAVALFPRNDSPSASLLVTTIESTRKVEKILADLLAGRPLEGNP